MRDAISKRRFVCFVHWLGFAHWSVGLHVHLQSPNIELHLPFCFVRVGWQGVYKWRPSNWLTFGWDYKGH